MGDRNYLDQKIELLVKEFESPSNVFIVVKTSLDGIIASSILSRALERKEINFNLRFINKLDSQTIQEINNVKADFKFILDSGTQFIDELNDFFVFGRGQVKEDNPRLINPYLFFDDRKKATVSSLVYLFVKSLHRTNVDLIDLAMLGIVADGCFLEGLNLEIEREAVENGFVNKKRSLDLNTDHSAPLFKGLADSFFPFVPRISGSQEKSGEFLRSLGIKIKEDGKVKSLFDLNDDELVKLSQGINNKRFGKGEVKIKELYKFTKSNSEIFDLIEFNNCLSACLRDYKPSVAYSLCLNPTRTKARVLPMLSNYRLAFFKILDWYYAGLNSAAIINGKNYTLINTEEIISPQLLESFLRLLIDSNYYSDKLILCSCSTFDGDLKIVSNSVENILIPEVLNLEERRGVNCFFVKRDHEAKFFKNLVESMDRLSLELIV
jgi:hypothetical protein